ncbi:carboxymethylenebutenolidase [Raphidocelis subcapitata]|uniref:Carboxymethylenebutenolidase n=1 Tax=Raphidocelis subcapitata TaxID=307507 RepID=A0A2V0PCV0_9CHLO|nr:carboxymethylenebutenolidase [Raphidocelis subcapitata]|eukprot:GBF97678.1 carboxymethylenebutenolidase [Raphidocelis subcapitata]
MALRTPSPRAARLSGARAKQRRLQTTPRASVGAAIAGGLIAALPASILVDELVDRASDRVGRLANAATPQGQRLYVARPPPAAAPAEAGAPAVVLVHQIFGLRQREVELCDDLAARGYVAVAPDAFGGASTGWLPRALALAYPAALAAGADWGVPAVAQAVAWLKQQPGVDPARVCVAGFCFGGASALRYAAAHPGQAAAAGVFYGRPLEGGGAGAYAPLAGVPVYGVYGGRDGQFSAEVVDGFEAGLEAAGARPELRRYPAQGHAFVTDIHAARAAGSDARDAWEGFADFLSRVL